MEDKKIIVRAFKRIGHWKFYYVDFNYARCNRVIYSWLNYRIRYKLILILTYQEGQSSKDQSN